MPEQLPSAAAILCWFNGQVVPLSSLQDEDERAELLDL